MLTIRLARIGKKKHPFYRVVVTEKTRPRNGRFVEIVGTYDPQKKPAAVDVDRERVQYWLSKGAQPSDTVRSSCCATLSLPKASYSTECHVHGSRTRSSEFLRWARHTVEEAAMKELVEQIAKALVDHPDQVQVQCSGRRTGDGSRTAGSSRRFGQSDRAAGTHGEVDSNAAGRRRHEIEEEVYARNPRVE